MMFKGFFKFMIGVFAAAAGVALVGYTVSDRKVRELEAQVSQLEHDRARLREYAQRLTASRRVAQITVLDKFADQYGDPVNRLLWQEIRTDGRLGPPQTVEAVGELVYFEAAVVKFEPELVGGGAEGRDFSLAFFRRVFGELQSAATVPFLETLPLDPSYEQSAGAIVQVEPGSRRGHTEPTVGKVREAAPTLGTPGAEFLGISADDEATAPGALAPSWAGSRIDRLFWELMENPQLASQYGVRVAQCEAPAVILRKGQVWEITLDAAGGINLRIIGHQTSGLRSTRLDPNWSLLTP